MVDGRANIDLLFRNGLKDYEVTPPAEVWTNLQPAVGRKKKYMFFLQSAATIALLVSVSIFAYRWGYEASKERFSAELANININNEPVTPVEIVIPSAIIPEKTETAAVIVTVSPQEFEEIAVPVVAKSEIIDVTYAESFNVDISKRLMAGMESFPSIQEPAKIKHDEVLLPEPQPIIYQDIYYENVVDNKNDRWSILAMASPMYQSQFTTSDNELAHKIMSSDKGRASYSGGMGFAYKINKRFSLQSGIYYSALGQELGKVNAYAGFEKVNPTKGSNNFKVPTSNGTVFSTNPDVFLSSNTGRVDTKYTPEDFDPNKNLNYLSNSIYQDLSFLELPLMLRFKAIDRKMGVSFIGGLSYNFLVDNSVYTIDGGGKYPVGTTEGLSNLSVSSSLGMGMEYKVSKSISFNVEPTFRYFLNSSNSDRINGLHNYAIGVFSGFSYKF